MLTSKLCIQILQKCNQSEKQKNMKNTSAGSSSHFVLPQILSCIFKFLVHCDAASRAKILGDLLDLLDSNPSNIEALMVLLISLSLHSAF